MLLVSRQNLVQCCVLLVSGMTKYTNICYHHNPFLLSLQNFYGNISSENPNTMLVIHYLKEKEATKYSDGTTNTRYSICGGAKIIISFNSRKKN